MKKRNKIIISAIILIILVTLCSIPTFAASAGGGSNSGGIAGGSVSGSTGNSNIVSGDVAGAVEDTWNDAKGQIKQVVNNVIFPVVDMILAIMFFVKLGTAYFDYRKHGQFEFVAPCILFACLVFTLTAPLYIWNIIGM